MLGNGAYNRGPMDVSGFPCRFCGTILEHRVVDLGMSPLCESYLTAETLDEIERLQKQRKKVGVVKRVLVAKFQGAA